MWDCLLLSFLIKDLTLQFKSMYVSWFKTTTRPSNVFYYKNVLLKLFYYLTDNILVKVFLDTSKYPPAVISGNEDKLNKINFKFRLSVFSADFDIFSKTFNIRKFLCSYKFSTVKINPMRFIVNPPKRTNDFILEKRILPNTVKGPKEVRKSTVEKFS